MPKYMDEDSGLQDRVESNKKLKKVSPLLASSSLRSLKRSLDHKTLELVEVNPKRCLPWQYHNRDKAWLTKERCKDLITSIQKNGQIEPSLLRPIQGNPDYDYEIIFGVRRWFASSQIPNQKLLSYLTDADDKTCMILMHAENADSEDISDFERATSFAKQMKSGVFKNQTEMAEAMGVSQSTISKMIKAAEIFEHPWVEELFDNKLDISIRYAYTLSTLLKKPQLLPTIQQEAQTILEEKTKMGLSFTGSKVLKRLIKKGDPNAERSLETTLIEVDHKPAISCYLDKLGKFHLVLESRAKKLSTNEIQQTCLKAMNEYLLK